MDAAYAAICGITQEELITNFAPEIDRQEVANELTNEEVIEKMTRSYDGYHFHPRGVGMFHPFSVLNSFSKLEFGSYWFATGTPTFIVELLQKSEYDLRTLIDGVEVPASAFTEYRAETNNPLPLIYKSGYLTIKGYDKRFGNYLLQFPNDEVKYGFLDFLNKNIFEGTNS